MGEFFKGWRRKAGLVTLAMACMLMAAWMRSYVVEDVFENPRQHSGQAIDSFMGRVCLSRWTVTSGMPVQEFGQPSFQWHSWEITDEQRANAPWDIYKFEWRWTWLGIDVGAAAIPITRRGAYSRRTEFCDIPYWSLVLPLTLLSAWLILGKRRKVKGAQLVDGDGIRSR